MSLTPPFPQLSQRRVEKPPPFPPSSRKFRQSLRAHTEVPLLLCWPVRRARAALVGLLVESGCPTSSAGFSGQCWEGRALGGL